MPFRQYIEAHYDKNCLGKNSSDGRMVSLDNLSSCANVLEGGNKYGV